MDNILFALGKERISAVLANIGDGVISADINGKIDYMNRSAELLTGWNIEEALEKSLEIVFDLINIKTREPAESPFSRAIKSGKQVGLSNYTALISKDRSEKLVSANASPIKSLEGQVMGVVIVFRDITSYKEFEDELKIERNNLRVNFENAPIGMAIINEEYRVLDANNSFLDTFGVRISDVIGKYYGEAINCKNSISKFCGFEYECMSCKLRESIFLVLQTSSPIKSVKIESTLVHRNEELQKHLKINFVPIVNYSKINVMISIEDITEHKKVEIEMRRAIESAHSAYRAKSDFLANMSHEIRTPLNGIIGMIELTRLTELNPEQKDNLLTAKTCADSLLRIINDILDFSKIEAGKFTLENIDFDLKALLEKIQKVHYYKAAEKGLKLSCQLPPNLPERMKGDPARLQQVLNNLIGNAVKFTEKGSVEIIISIDEYDEKTVNLQFSVVDTGIGISLEEKAKLFKSFSQVDSSHSRKYGGTGLGLVISKQLIEMMGGKIWAESVKGKGSVFNFQLVFEISNKNNGVCGDSDYYKLEKPLGTISVLLVEDDSINQIVVGRMLKKLGYLYSIANNGVEAINLLKDKYFDLCLMDIQMPGMDGIQTTQILRSLEKSTGKHLPIIALTAHALMGDREKFISLGMDDYLAKPFLINDLQNTVSSLLSKYESKNSADIFKKLLTGQNIKAEVEMNIDSFSENDRSVIAEIKENISGLMELSRLGDITTIEKLAHEIKQLSVMINAEKVKVLAFRVELAARRGDFAEAVELAGELDSVFKKYTNCVYNLKTNLE